MTEKGVWNTKQGKVSDLEELLSGIDVLVNPDIPRLNKQKHRLLHACLCAYAKHHCGNEGIGWDELSDFLLDAICEEIGDDNFHKWIKVI